ncbi:MAG: phosphoadenylyl-sulfate reductase [Deltaproteobacteria bacterium]|nr:phosphoadenylyl-sulfate reductase [Deltaproteobacteria bacterium]
MARGTVTTRSDGLGVRALRRGPGRVLASSLSAEDQVLAEQAAGLDPRPAFFTLDTGRLFPESYDLVERTRERYGVAIEVVFPERAEVEAMVSAHGVNLFYRSPELRRRCCDVRKVAPLRRRLAGLSAWITGLRRGQAATRTEIARVERDAANGLVKVNPLADWDEAAVWAHVHDRGVPYNPLHDRGFPSIGCAPCTRAVAPGEDPRAGRWWWERPEQKECGLHARDGRLVRARDGTDGGGDAAARNPGED